MKNYYCVTYLETDCDGNTSFGNVGGMIYETEVDAMNALKNDIEEYLEMYNMPKDYKVDHLDGTNHWEFIHCTNLKMEWEIQKMNNSLEFNDVEKDEPEKKFSVCVHWALEKYYEVSARDEFEAENKIRSLINSGEVNVYKDGYETCDDIDVFSCGEI